MRPPRKIGATSIKEAISANDGERAAKSIQDHTAYNPTTLFPKTWPANCEQRARIIGRLRRALWPDLISSAM